MASHFPPPISASSSSPFTSWPPTKPVASTSANATTPHPAPTPSSQVHKHRLSKTGISILQTFFRTISTTPSSKQFDCLLTEIHAIPGDEGYTMPKLKNWFVRRRTKENQDREAAAAAELRVARVVTKADEEEANPLFYSLHRTQKGFDVQQTWHHTDPQRRPELYDMWVQRYGDGDPEVQRQIRAWIAHTEVHGLPADAIRRLQASRLSIDVSVQEAYGGNGLLTPPTTTSPEPPSASSSHFPGSVSRGNSAARELRHTPYPTPSSRALSLPLKSEPAASPLISIPALPASAPAPYIHAPQPLPPTFEIQMLNAINHEFKQPQAPEKPPANAEDFHRLCRPFQNIVTLTRTLEQATTSRESSIPCPRPSLTR
ncbi:hypothetical protein C8J57DRAFT_1282490 [Mycena rebaudengoi]|nr:hypothetical protein C8J57DRAFT_1282490 [Mycena rebaudengoi]